MVVAKFNLLVSNEQNGSQFSRNMLYSLHIICVYLLFMWVTNVYDCFAHCPIVYFHIHIAYILPRESNGSPNHTQCSENNFVYPAFVNKISAQNLLFTIKTTKYDEKKPPTFLVEQMDLIMSIKFLVCFVFAYVCLNLFSFDVP